MRKLVTIDLTAADTDAFEAYERKVMPLLQKHAGRLELSVRSVDGTTEAHLLYFPDASNFEAFLSDPEREGLKDEWSRIGAVSTVTEVEEVRYC